MTLRRQKRVPSAAVGKSLGSLRINGCRLWVFAAAVFLVLNASDWAAAQGLSGTPQRLDETLGQRGGGQGDQGQGSYGGGDPSMDEMMEMEMEEAYGDDVGYGDDDGYGEEEGYGDGGYGGGYGGPPSRGRVTGTPKADAVQTYGSSLTALMGGLDLTPLFAPNDEIAVESGPFLAREAEQAFESGNQPLALDLMFGHMATEYEDAIVAIQSIKYNKVLKRPVWSIRWGVSMAVRGGDGVTDAQPIREGATPMRSIASQGRSGGGGFEDYGSDDYGSEEYGSEMEDQSMQDDMDRQMEEEMAMEMDMERGGGYGGSQRAPTRPKAPEIPERKMLSDEAGQTLDQTLGLVAEVVAEGFAKRLQNGDFGPLFASTAAPEIVEPAPGGARPPAVAAVESYSSMSAALNDALNDVAEPLPMWKPAILYLGECMGFDEIVPSARAGNFDFVLHFDVVLKPGRNGSMQNISRCRLIHVASGKSIGVSKGMDNREAAQMASAGRMNEREYIEQQLSNLFLIIDRDVKVTELPNVSVDQARKRIASLIGGSQARSLRTLAEVRYYQARDLIDQRAVEAAFDIVGSVDGLMLLHGPAEERVVAARKWAVESQGTGGDR